jgi:hypothetical protein
LLLIGFLTGFATVGPSTVVEVRFYYIHEDTQWC